MHDFLPQLKKLQPITSAKGGKTMTGKEIFFLIKTGENDAFIIPVDKKLKPVDADYHYYSGDTAQLLRSIDAIKEEMAFQISWDDENEANDASSHHLDVLQQEETEEGLCIVSGYYEAYPKLLSIL